MQETERYSVPKGRPLHREKAERVSSKRIVLAERGTTKPRRSDNVINGTKRFPPTPPHPSVLRGAMPARNVSILTHRTTTVIASMSSSSSSLSFTSSWNGWWYLEGSRTSLYRFNRERETLTRGRRRRRRGQRFTLMHVVYSSRPYLGPQFRGGCVRGSTINAVSSARFAQRGERDGHSRRIGA